MFRVKLTNWGFLRFVSGTPCILRSHHHHHHRNDNDQQNVKSVYVTWSVLLVIGNSPPLIVLSSQQHWPDRMAQETLSKQASKFIC
jgi:hypothetical protein